MTAGCECFGKYDKGIRKPNGVASQQCNYFEKLAQCNDISSIKEQPISVYQDKLLCKKPMQSNYTFYNINLPYQNGSCPPGERICGSKESIYH